MWGLFYFKTPIYGGREDLGLLAFRVRVQPGATRCNLTFSAVYIFDRFGDFQLQGRHQFIHDFRRFALHFMNQMTIDIHRCAGFRMPQYFRDHDDRHAMIEHQRSGSMPQIMESNLRQVCRLKSAMVACNMYEH